MAPLPKLTRFTLYLVVRACSLVPAQEEQLVIKHRRHFSNDAAQRWNQVWGCNVCNPEIVYVVPRAFRMR